MVNYGLIPVILLNIYDDIINNWNMCMIFIICDIIEFYVVFNGWYVIYDTVIVFFCGNLSI